MWSKLMGGDENKSTSKIGRRKPQDSSARRRTGSNTHASSSTTSGREGGDDRSNRVQSIASTLQSWSREPKKDNEHDSRRADKEQESTEGRMKRKEQDNGGPRTSDKSTEKRSIGPKTNQGEGGGIPFAAQVDSAGFTQLPGQYNESIPNSAPTVPPRNLSSYVQDQFPGQRPLTAAAPSQHPSDTATPSGYGEAASYYNDTGESVQYQPGVRRERPSVIAGTQPHLMTPTAASAPPQETGSGSAADFYGSSTTDQPPNLKQPSKPIRPPLPGSSTYPGLSGGLHDQSGATVAAKIGYTGAAVTGNDVYQTIPGVRGVMAPNAPIRPTNRVDNSNSSSRPSKQLSASSASPRAAGARGLAAASHGSHNGTEPSNQPSGPSTARGSSYVANSPSYGQGTMSMEQRHSHQGPVAKFVDWWKDYEDVRRMEAYMEYIGVCRGCFDPRSTVWDAPRDHLRRRRSSDSIRSDRSRNDTKWGYRNRVDKDYRYNSSDTERRRRKAKTNWVGTLTAGLGLAQAGQFLWNSKTDGQELHSSRTGQTNASKTPMGLARSRNHSAERRAHKPTNSASDIRSVQNAGSIGDTVKRSKATTYPDDSDRLEPRPSASRPRAGSRGRTTGFSSAKPGELISAASSTIRRSRSSSRSKRRDAASSGHRRGNESMSDPRESRPLMKDVSAARLPPLMEPRHRTPKARKGGFFSWANSSSSSSEGLAYGSKVHPRLQNSSKRSKEKENNDIGSTIFGLGAAAAALAATGTRGRGYTQRPADLVAVKEPKARRALRRSRKKRPSPSSSEDEEKAWESASESGDCSSVNSGLAFGDYVPDGMAKASRSTESLLSESSGINKWGWRWGMKKKRKQSPARNSDVQSEGRHGRTPAGTTGKNIAQPLHPNHGSATHSNSTLPTMQQLDPMPMTDTYDLDSVRLADARPHSMNDSVGHRPGPVPLQQPQPLTPVSPAVYERQTAMPSQFSVPTGSPVFATAKRSNRPSDTTAALGLGYSAPTVPMYASDGPFASAEPRPSIRSTIDIPSYDSNGLEFAARDLPSVRFQFTQDQAAKHEKDFNQPGRHQSEVGEANQQAREADDIERLNRERRERRRVERRERAHEELEETDRPVTIADRQLKNLKDSENDPSDLRHSRGQRERREFEKGDRQLQDSSQSTQRRSNVESNPKGPQTPQKELHMPRTVRNAAIVQGTDREAIAEKTNRHDQFPQDDVAAIDGRLESVEQEIRKRRDQLKQQHKRGRRQSEPVPVPTATQPPVL